MPRYFENVPKIIRIGVYEHFVSVRPRLGKKGTDRGQYNGLEILLRREHKTPHDALDTVLHEVLHGIYDKAGMAKMVKGDVEEKLVDTMASWLTAVFIDNPLLLKWIGEMVIDDGEKE